MKSLLIIDGNALIHRAYHALPDFKTKNGIPTNAVYGFASVMHKVRDELKPSHLLVCFDTAAPTFRDDMFEEYRSHRPETEPNLIKQFPMVRDLLDAAGIQHVEKDGVEADDLIAMATRLAEEQKIHVVILTGDKDIFQLIREGVSVLTPAIGFSKGKLYDRNEVIQKFGVPPEKIADYKALVGDPSDNYKGVKGIGPKSAVALLEQFGSIESIYNHIDDVTNPRLQNLLKKEKEHALLSKKLAVLLDIIDDVEIDIDATQFSDYNETLKDFFKEYQFNSLAKRFFNNVQPAPAKEEKHEEEDNQLGLF